MAGLEPEAMEEEENRQPINHQTTERRSWVSQCVPLITLDDLEDVSSSVFWHPSPELHEAPRVRSHGDWEGSDHWQPHRCPSRCSPPTRRRRYCHRSSSSLSSSTSLSGERFHPIPISMTAMRTVTTIVVATCCLVYCRLVCWLRVADGEAAVDQLLRCIVALPKRDPTNCRPAPGIPLLHDWLL